MLENGFDPAVGTSYEFLLFAPGDLTGNFATILGESFNGDTEKWVVTIDNPDGFVELTAESNAGTTRNRVPSCCRALA